MLDGVAEAVCVVVRGVDAPAKADPVRPHSQSASPPHSQEMQNHTCQDTTDPPYHLSPARWCGVNLTRYATGSIFPSSITSFIRSVASPSPNLPFRMSCGVGESCQLSHGPGPHWHTSPVSSQEYLEEQE